MFLQRAADAHQRAPGSQARHEDIDVRNGIQDLRARRRFMGQRVGLISILIEHPVARLVGRHALGHLDGAIRTPATIGRNDFGAERPQQLPPLIADVLRHDSREPIALDLADHRQRDAGVAAGWLDQRVAGGNAASALGFFDHEEGDAVFDAPRGVEALDLGEDANIGLGTEALELDRWRVADGVEDGLVQRTGERARSGGVMCS